MTIERELRPRYVPGDEAALRKAFDEGFLKENAYQDLKRELPAGKAENTELAKDLASFSAFGGTLFIGLDETAPGGDPMHPIPLAGLRERIEQVALQRVDPSLHVESIEVDSANAVGLGYIVVNIPASPMAPHQVEGRYYGRSDSTKYNMHDAEAQLLFQRREQWNRGAGEVLDAFVADAPYADSASGFPQLFVVAQPVGAPQELCRALIGDARWQSGAISAQKQIPNNERLKTMLTDIGNGWARPLTDPLNYQFRTADGVLLTTRSQPTVFKAASEKFAVDFEVREDGGLRLFAARVGDPGQLFNGISFIGLYLDRIAIAVHEVLVAAQYISAQTGHGELWDFGVAINRISGARAVRSVGDTLRPLGTGYTKGEYRTTIRATLLEIETAPEKIIDRLLGRLARSLGATELFPTLFEP